MAILGRSLILYIAVAAVVLSLFTPEVECRRQVLRGRKTVTRRYLRPMAVPAWAIIILVGLGQLVIGAIIYIIMRKTIIDPPMQGTYTMANMNEA